ncbi:hypothetical protein I317_06144 [Kwoniella heveanensis CBS 569]|nr:hypothetical protein I317_06144 [Kwoniella heveanensis CBS 569]
MTAPTRSEAFLALSQEVSALITLSYETAASLVHDKYHASVGFWGLGEWVKERHDKAHEGESGRGYAVVVVGANESIGQALTLRLAKSGYTVFPLMPLPSPDSPPTSEALSQLLLTWSSVQKRIRAKRPRHCGQVVPVIVDPENIAQDLSRTQRGDLKRSPSSESSSTASSSTSSGMGGLSPTFTSGTIPKAKHREQPCERAGIEPAEDEEGSSRWRNRFGHAGETVRAYCRENNLHLVAIVCAPRNAPKVRKPHFLTSPSPEEGSEEHTLSPAKKAQQMQDDWEGIASIGPQYLFSSTCTDNGGVRQRSHPHSTPPWAAPSSLSTKGHRSSDSVTSASTSTSPRTGLPYAHDVNPYEMIGLSPYALTLTDESTLASLYRSNVIDPLSVVKELTEFMSFTHAIGKGRARVIFINGGLEGGISEVKNGNESIDREAKGAMRVVNAARREARKIMRKQLRGLGIEVCEVVVGAMIAPRPMTRHHLRHSSEDSLSSITQLHRIPNSRRTVSDALSLPSNLSILFRKYFPTPWRLTREDVIESRYQALSTIWAVDDALLFSCVRRAIEDRYPRSRHHAGLTAVLEDLADKVPGGGIAERWVEWAGRGVLGWRVWDWVFGDGARF